MFIYGTDPKQWLVLVIEKVWSENTVCRVYRYVFISFDQGIPKFGIKNSIKHCTTAAQKNYCKQKVVLT